MIRLHTGRSIAAIYIITPPPLVHGILISGLQTTVHVVADRVLEESTLFNHQLGSRIFQ